MPEMLVFSVIAFLSHSRFQQVFDEQKQQQYTNIVDEIESLHDVTKSHLSLIEQHLDEELEIISYQFIDHFRGRYKELETKDLNVIRHRMGLDPLSDDIYIINRNGVIINTTFEADMGKNLFHFGEIFKSYLLNIFEEGVFHPGEVTPEEATGNFRKYSYMPTPDGEYIIEIGKNTDEIIAFQKKVRDRIKSIIDNFENVEEVDVCIELKGKPFSFYSDNDLSEDKEIVDHVISHAKDTSLVVNDSLHYNYIYYSDPDNNWSSAHVIKLVFNQTYEKQLIARRTRDEILIFGVGLMLLSFSLLLNSRKIAQSLHRIIRRAKEIGEGKLKVRVTLEGTKETATLAEEFNTMAHKLEIYQNELENQNKLVEEKNEEITDSITYARRIQQAILPSQDKIKADLDDFFILYRPKDIVAGDFYWYRKVGDVVLFSAADCTGHGVPGAMVSVVCIQALNRAVREFNLTRPAEVLDKVRELVIETFYQDGEEVKDGMDLGLCALNLKTGELEFAGANNALYIIRPKHENSIVPENTLETETHYLVEYKACKMPIGQYILMEDFTNQKIDFVKGDQLIMSTDGYADQFGGERGKKLKYKPFKRLLLDMATDSCENQHDRLNDFFTDWLGDDHEQIDDVCVFGVKI